MRLDTALHTGIIIVKTGHLQPLTAINLNFLECSGPENIPKFVVMNFFEFLHEICSMVSLWAKYDIAMSDIEGIRPVLNLTDFFS